DYNKFEIKSKILLTLVSTFVSLIAFGYCLLRLWTDQIQFGDMTFFLQQRSSLSNRFNTLVGTIPGMLNSAVSAHRIRELMDLPREAHDEAAYAHLEKIADKGISVKLSGVSFAYIADDKKIYEGASFEANPGEIVAVLSPSGGGKTTLMRLLLGMLEPDTGSVTLTGCDGKSIPINADLRRFFAYVPQGNTLLAGTVADNMRMAKENATDDEIKAALDTACALEFTDKIKDGINGKLGERGRGISEGQAQRIAIARAVLRNSPVLLLDEATSALDIDTEERVLKSIVKQHPNKVIIISTHRPSALKLCKRIYRIADGGIKETDINEAQTLMWRYSDMPDENKSRRDIKLPDMPLSPKNETTILPDDTGNGWWNG
ncbi:MAG: ABC transporter ATP-binding protein, partial [Clostridia bacterium]|nr:ABC transporter ATP-binding protein [Clostridia bacterium]